MTTKFNWAFEDLNAPSRAYLYNLLKPYRDALSVIDNKGKMASINAIKDWVRTTMSEQFADKMIRFIDTIITDPNVLKEIVSIKDQILIELILSLSGPVETEHKGDEITPWDLAKYRDDELTRLFGPATDKLDVYVNYNDKSYTYSLTEEFMYGILLVLDCNREFRIYTSGEILEHEQLEDKYDYDTKNGFKYFAHINGMEIGFHTTDFVQGVMTGCQWIKVDPHTKLIKLAQINTNDSWTPLNF